MSFLLQTHTLTPSELMDISPFHCISVQLSLQLSLWFMINDTNIPYMVRIFCHGHGHPDSKPHMPRPVLNPIPETSRTESCE